VLYRDRNLEMRDRSKLLVTCSIDAGDCQGQLGKVHVLIVCTRFFKKLESNSQVHHFLNIQVLEVGDVAQL
jgi:hypothetical protein